MSTKKKPAKTRTPSGWGGTLWTAIKECAGTGSTFVKECDQSARNAINEISGTKRKKRR